MTEPARATPHSAPRPDPTRRGIGDAPRHLRVVEPRRRHRSRRQRTRLVLVVATTMGLAVAFGLVYLHVLLAQRQIELDSLQTRVAAQESAYQSLRLEVANLAAPQQIISTAEGKLGMRQPTSVIYLSPPPRAPGQVNTARVNTARVNTARVNTAQSNTGQKYSAGAARQKPSAGASGRKTPAGDAVTAPTGEADWPKIKEALAGSP